MCRCDAFWSGIMGNQGFPFAGRDEDPPVAELGGSCGWEGTGPHPHDQVSPISFASKIRTPVLIVHGEDDTNVPVSQAIYFHRALSWYGAEHELVIYPREGHGFVERNHQLDLLRRTRAWFDRWLRDEAPDGRGSPTVVRA
jgi:pimeloyl-ACP methyl ester carboxylesterase